MGFGRYSFRNIRNGKVSVTMASSQAEALKALTIYPIAFEFVGWSKS